MAGCQTRSQAVVSSGGKSTPGGDGLAGDAQGSDEAHPVGVMSAVLGGVGHQGADRVVAAQMAISWLTTASSTVVTTPCTIERWNRYLVIDG